MTTQSKCVTEWWCDMDLGHSGTRGTAGNSARPTDSVPGMDPEPMRLALIRLGLLQEGEQATLTPLTGGIASDIWKVELSSRTLCIKRALHRLKVKADWFVPIERNLYEWSYLEIADRAAPGSAPQLVARDTEAYLFVMEYLDPGHHPLWKHQLRDGIADAAFATDVGRRLVTIHAYTAARPEIGGQFPTDAIFYASRMESYLEATARVHPDLEAHIMPLIHATIHETCPRARRRESEEHTQRSTGTGPARPRVRLLRRPCLRPRFLSQSPAAEVSVESIRAGGVPQMLRIAEGDVLARGRLGAGRGYGGPYRPIASGSLPGEDRREITG